MCLCAPHLKMLIPFPLPTFLRSREPQPARRGCPPARGFSLLRARAAAARLRRRARSFAATRGPRVPSADGWHRLRAAGVAAAPPSPCSLLRRAAWEVRKGTGCRRGGLCPPAWVQAGSEGVLWLFLQIPVTPPLSPTVCPAQRACTVSLVIRLQPGI